MNTLRTDPSALNEFFNKTAERVVGKNAKVILYLIDSFTNNPNSFKLRKATYDEVLR